MKSKKKKITLLKMAFVYDEDKIDELRNENVALNIEVEAPKFPINMSLPADVLISLAKFETDTIAFINKLVQKSQEGYGDE